jgi:hypothetical protein
MREAGIADDKIEHGTEIRRIQIEDPIGDQRMVRLGILLSGLLYHRLRIIYRAHPSSVKVFLVEGDHYSGPRSHIQ